VAVREALPAPMPCSRMRSRAMCTGSASRTATRSAATPDIGSTIREILHPEFRLLAEELLRTQVYVASRTRGSTLSRVYLNGSLARYPHIQERLSELVALPVEVLNPFDAFTPAATPATSQAWSEISKSIALAAGLALRKEQHG
jgi:type IV pilus assembly protein PilM